MSHPRIFVSYRRADAGGEAGRLYDGLVEAFGAERVFRDVSSIEFGDDFVRSIRENLEKSDVVLVVIGPDWAGGPGEAGATRLFDERDFVRFEVDEALRGRARLIPVLVGGARMPQPDEVPEVLRPLLDANAFSLREDRDHHFLVEEIRTPGGARREERQLGERHKLDPKPLVALAILAALLVVRLDRPWLLTVLALPAVLCGWALWDIRRTGRRGAIVAVAGLALTLLFAIVTLAT